MHDLLASTEHLKGGEGVALFLKQELFFKDHVKNDPTKLKKTL